MNILVTNNHLKTYGGSETFTYTLIEELCRLGHHLEYFTFEKGLTSNKIEQNLNVHFFSRKKYDLILANHNSCITFLRKIISHKTTIIQTCHGIYPELEQPSNLANLHISISEEIQKHLLTLGYASKIILNGINTNRFDNKTSINKELKTVLSLSQSEQANSEIEKACNLLNIQLLKLNKFKNPIWKVEEEINKADLIVGLGRSAYEAMACGRAVLIYDNRPYSKSYADGYVTSEILPYIIKNNCSGRFYKKELDTVSLVKEFKKYNKESGYFLRQFSLENLNIKIQVEKYLQINEEYKGSPELQKKILISNFQSNIMFYLSLPYIIFNINKWCKRYGSKKVNKIKITKKIITSKLNKAEFISMIKNGNL